MTITATDSRPSAPIEQTCPLPSATTGAGQASTGSAIPSVFELLLLQQVIAKPSFADESSMASAGDSANTRNNAAHDVTADPRLSTATATNDGLSATAAAIVNLFAMNQSTTIPSTNANRSAANDSAAAPSTLQPFASSNRSATAIPFLKMFAATMPSRSSASTSPAVTASVDQALSTTPTVTVEPGTDVANVLSKCVSDAPANLNDAQLAAKTADLPVVNDSIPSASALSASVPLVPAESSTSALANLPSIDLVQRQPLHFAVQGMNVDTVSAASVASTRALIPATLLSSLDSSQDHDPDNSSSMLTVAPGATMNPISANSTPAPVSDQLATSIVQQLSDESTGGTTTVRLRLDREDLGTVHLHLSVHNDVVSVRIVAQDQLARQIIENQMADLRRALTGGGIELGRFEVTCDSGRGQSSNGQRTNQPYASVGGTSAGRWTRPQPTLESISRSTGQLNIVA